MSLYLYNTLTRKKDAFKPLKKGQVGLYSCGPTVYLYQHIGNMRTYIFVDILKRVLLFDGFKVKHVMNVTDVGHLTSDADFGEDKMELAVKKENKSAKEIANFYLSAFKSDLDKFNIIYPDFWPKATEHIKDQINLIEILEKKGFIYKTNDGIYFDSTKFKSYGKMARLYIPGLQKGKRIAVGEKKHKTDFALWKFSQKAGERQQEWKSPWSVGYPGWHIECSAMAMKYLGNHFDIHTGGEDHIPVHHTNEIAQSEAATGKKFVNYWMHGAFLTFKGEKVSKSRGGLYTITELEELGYKAEHFRYLCLMTHYRKQLDFSLEALDAARNAYEKLVARYVHFRTNTNRSDKNYEPFLEYLSKFKKAINDDLNMPAALGIVWDIVGDGNLSHHQRVSLINKFDKVLGLGLANLKEETIPTEIMKLVEQRMAARTDKNWKLADKLRDDIRKLGYDVEDTESGAKVVPK